MAKDNFRKQQGVSLIITLFIMIIVLSVVLSISALLYSELKVIRNIGNSVVGLYAADSGIEKILYYDWQVGLNDNRGLCTMLQEKAINISEIDNPNACRSSGEKNPSQDQSIFCDYQEDLEAGVNGNNPSTGCNPDVCNDCMVTFTTSIDDKISYTANAKVYETQGEDGENITRFEINSKGLYGGAGRQLQIVIDTEKEDEPDVDESQAPPEWVTNVQATCSSPKKISADVIDPEDLGITRVEACWTDSEYNTECDDLQSQGDGNWSKPWSPDNNTTYFIIVTASYDDGSSNSGETDVCCGNCS